jgi:ATP synthase protein I
VSDIDSGSKDPKDDNRSWEERVRKKERRKIRARSEKSHSIWFGLGMFGVIGWSIAVPTVIGIFLGLWIDRNWPSQFSWTLMLMFTGLVIGCYNAWRWVNTESGMDRRSKDKEQDEDK